MCDFGRAPRIAPTPAHGFIGDGPARRYEHGICGEARGAAGVGEIGLSSIKRLNNRQCVIRYATTRSHKDNNTRAEPFEVEIMGCGAESPRGGRQFRS